MCMSDVEYEKFLNENKEEREDRIKEFFSNPEDFPTIFYALMSSAQICMDLEEVIYEDGNVSIDPITEDYFYNDIIKTRELLIETGISKKLCSKM